MKKPNTFNSLAALVEQARGMVADFETVTFDLFDTLLVRRIHDPDLVKRPVARYVSSLAASHGIVKSSRTVQKTRNRIELEQRQETGIKFEDQEACYPFFMEQTLREIFGDRYEADLLEKVTKYELEMESRMLVPRKLVLSHIFEQIFRV